MAYATPPTKALGDSAPASDWNTYVRDVATHFADTHDHGSSDHGAKTLGGTGGLTYVRFTDAAAPAAPGAGKTALYAVSGKHHQRAGAAGADEQLDITTHTHAITEQRQGETVPVAIDTTAVLSGDVTALDIIVSANTSYTDTQTDAFTPAAGSSVAVFATIVGISGDGGGGSSSHTIFVRILEGASQKVEVSLALSSSLVFGQEGRLVLAMWTDEDVDGSAKSYESESKLTGTFTGGDFGRILTGSVATVEVGF